MKFVCDRSALQETLAAAASVALTRTPKPILECVHIAAKTDSLILTAYDQEVGIRSRVDGVDITERGETVVHCARFKSIVDASTDETMSLETEDDSLHIRGNDSHFQVVGQDAKEFPPVPDMQGEPNVAMKVGPMRAAIEKTLFAAARESTRYAINGVLWQQDGKGLRMVATDGRRLALSNTPLVKPVAEDTHAIVPAKALTLLSRLHLDADETLDGRIMPNQIIMQTGRATISSVLVEGNFPRWDDVIPQGNDILLELKTETLLSAVRRAALLASVESKGIIVELTGDALMISSRSAERGEASIRVPVDCRGAKMRIGFNPEFLADALKVCEEDVTLELKDSTRPGLLKSGKDFQYVVMPVNLS